MKSNRGFVWLCVGILVAGVGLVIAVNQNWFGKGDDGSQLAKQREREEKAAEDERLANLPDNRKSLADALGISEDELEEVGGVLRPKRDVAFDSTNNKSDSESAEPPSIVEIERKRTRVGVAPRLKGNENAQVAGLVAELTAEQPVKAAMSSYFQEERFDREAYVANPASYLNKIRPGRAYAPADPAEDVTPLESLTPGFHRVLQGEQVVLRVKAAPKMPVTFYSPHTGHFTQNKLTTLSVEAGEDGIATATYKTGPGSLGLTDVVVASPANSGQIQYRINVELPEGPLGDN